MPDRRRFIRLCARLTGLGLFALLRPGRLFASPSATASPFAATLAAELGAHYRGESDRIVLEVPQIAEDGAIVPISIDADISGISELVILAERNPNPIAARFKFSEPAEPFVYTRIKLNETGDVVVIAKTGDGSFYARKNVKVLVGGCG